MNSSNMNHHSFNLKTTIVPVTDAISPALAGPGFLLIALALVCFAVLPAAQAECPSICDSNENTAIGDFALSHNTTGFSNTATGFNALRVNTTGSDNTATGDSALPNNTTGGANTANGA